MRFSTSPADARTEVGGEGVVEILRVFNNNVVLANDHGREVILTGRGLGF
ncbi:CAT RNA binding domain-containing protein, partial [uncultured Bifidobacterium sp.]